MPSFLIVHSQPPGGRADLFAQPPTIDVSGLGARLDWGDVTFEVPPGDHRVTISVDPVAGGRDGAVVTVRVLPETGTRISFAPPAAPGMPSTLRVDGQWPADAAMAYYATRDRRVLTPSARPQGQPTGHGQPWQPTGQGQPSHAPSLPQQGSTQPRWAPPQVAPPAPAPQQAAPQPSWQPPQQPALQQPAPQQTPPPQAPQPAVPAVGPSIGSTGSVPVVAPPSSAPTFGQVQGAHVVPGAQQPHPPARPPMVQAPTWGTPAQAAPPQQPSMQPPPPQPRVQPPVQQQAPQPRVQPPSQQMPQQQQLPQQPQLPQHPGHSSQAPAAFGPGAPQQPPMQQGQQSPAFGHQAPVRRDAYGRDRVVGDRSAPPIPTPSEFQDFARGERERQEAAAVAATRQQQGWYPDPYGRSEVRWHDGERWTPSVMRQGRREHDPL
ncbi:hypothetical protein GCM10009846_03510 [Agrococcus versicolor]|uniref:DUF2510 domain-containing protein n=2 Tax=Agrococcus versicolor TaxID=501482 RepID=A0ABN3AJK6_9MICO